MNMAESRVVRARKNIIWSLVYKFVAVLLPFITQTILIYILGAEYVGLSGLFKSILGMLSLAELGFGSALIFSMYKPIAQNDTEKVCELLAFYKKCYRIIGIVITLIGLGIIPFLKHLISGNLPEGINIYILYIITLANSVISYIAYAYKRSLIIACQRIDLLNIIDSIITILMCISQSAILLTTHNYYGYISVNVLMTLLSNMVVQYLSKQRYPQYFCKGTLDYETKKIIKKKVSGLIYQKVGNIVLVSVDSIVISAFLGLSVLGFYNNYYYVVAVIASIMGIFTSSIIPIIGNTMVRGSIDKIYSDFKFNLFAYLWIVEWCSICYLCLIQPFIIIWIGEKFLLDWKMVVLFFFYLYIHHAGDMCYAYKEASGIWWEGRYVTLISSIINLVLNLILVQKFGLYGILISTILSIGMINLPFGGKVLFDTYFKEIVDGWKKYIIKQGQNLIITIGIGTITYWLCQKVMYKGFLLFVIRLIICIVVPNILYVILNCKSAEFKKMPGLIKKIFRCS